jgi:hypothetical protein
VKEEIVVDSVDVYMGCRYGFIFELISSFYFVLLMQPACLCFNGVGGMLGCWDGVFSNILLPSFCV